MVKQEGPIDTTRQDKKKKKKEGGGEGRFGVIERERKESAMKGIGRRVRRCGIEKEKLRGRKGKKEESEETSKRALLNPHRSASQILDYKMRR